MKTKTRQAHKGAWLSWLSWAGVGFGAGLLNGLLGAAGGILLVTLLPHLHPPTKTLLPSNTSLKNPKDMLVISLCVMLPVTVVSLGLYLWQGKHFDPHIAGVIALPAALGGLFGAYLLGKIPRHLLRKIFGLLVAISGVRMLWG